MKFLIQAKKVVLGSHQVNDEGKVKTISKLCFFTEEVQLLRIGCGANTVKPRFT